MAKILIVDDDPDITFAVSLLLKKQDYEVMTSSNRADAMKTLVTFKPDLMILDVMMEQPDDGIAMAQELRRTGHTLPIVMLTSVSRVTGMSFDRDDDLVPVDAFFEKPAEPAVLLAKVRELLDRKGAR
jgi:DNA-binding response OmpR family regulator